MNIEEISGGVSPMKKKWKGKASRGKGGQKRSIKGKLAGSAGIRNTSTKKGRRGFSRAGAKGVNVHGYGALTRFKPHTYKGPLAPATTPKSGGSGGNGGSGGSTDNSTTTYNIDSHDVDNSVDKSVNTDFSNADLSTNIGNVGSEITNKTNTNVNQKNTNKQENTNKTKQSIKSNEKYTYRQSWDDNAKNVQGKYKNFEEYKKAAIAWNNSPAGKKYWANKNRTNQSNENTQSNESNVANENVNNASNIIKNVGPKINISGAKYKEKFNSPNKMRSHAWDMLQKQKKARGGTQKY